MWNARRRPPQLRNAKTNMARWTRSQSAAATSRTAAAGPALYTEIYREGARIGCNNMEETRCWRATRQPLRAVPTCPLYQYQYQGTRFQVRAGQLRRREDSVYAGGTWGTV